MSIILYGYHYSVYTRIVRMVLAAKDIAYRYIEIDPFSDSPDPFYLDLHPFGRVPVIRNNGFTLYETVAIARYLDEISGSVLLSPPDPESRARMMQMIHIVDSYGYWPMVRQVFAHRVFRVKEGLKPDESVIAEGTDASRKVCEALDMLVDEGAFLTGATISHADLHLGAMMAYFTLSPEGLEIVNSFPRLQRWWDRMAGHALLRQSDPGLPVA
jgi:glutathione S-transferase